MAYYPEELEWAPEVISSIDGKSYQLERHAGRGYPSGDPGGTNYWPGSPPLGSTSNPHGFVNSPDEYPPLEMVPEAHPVQGHRYSFKTLEQKIDYINAGPTWPVWSHGEVGFEYDFSRLDLLFQFANGTTPVLDNGTEMPVGYAGALTYTGAGPATNTGDSTRPRWYTPGYIWNNKGAQLLYTPVYVTPQGTLVAKVKGRGAHSSSKWMVSSNGGCNLGVNINGFLCGIVGNVVDTVILGPDIADQMGVAALTWDATTIKLYWNAVEVYSGPAGTPPTPGQVFLLSQSNDSELYRVLGIDRVLTLEEIALFNYWVA